MVPPLGPSSDRCLARHPEEVAAEAVAEGAIPAVMATPLASSPDPLIGYWYPSCIRTFTERGADVSTRDHSLSRIKYIVWR